jgi:hypothetical protein
MNRMLLTWLAAATCMFSVASLAHADRVQQDLDAKVTFGLGIFIGLEGETVQVRVVYDDEMLEEFPGGGLGDSYKTEFPESNGAFDVGVEIEVNGIVRSSVGKGDDGIADHVILILDEPQRDEWQIDTRNFNDPIDQGFVELIGDGSYVLPGDAGLAGVPVFPPDYCATGNAGGESATGNFTAFAGGQWEGRIQFDILQGPTCSPSSALCGDANGDGMISATDALIGLGAAVGTGMCMACRCDVDNSGMTSATDALAILQAAVGQPVSLNCPAC